MSKRFLTVSDLTGQPIDNDADVVTIVVHEHPTLERPVQLDAGKDEIKKLTASTKDFVLVEVISDGGDSRERIIMELDAFEGLIAGDAQEVLEQAEPYSITKQPVQEAPRRGRPAGSAGAKPEKVDYKVIENAGQPHRGVCTEEEKELVRENLDEVNKRRVANGHPPIDPADSKMAARYGFDMMKVEDRPKLSPQFTG